MNEINIIICGTGGQGVVLVSELLGEATVAGQHHGEQDAGIEAGAGQQPQFVQDDGTHLLGFVDEQHRVDQRGFKVLLPALAQHLRAGPAVVWAQRHGEEITELAVKIGQIALRAGQRPDVDFRELLQPFGQQPQHHAFPGAGLARHQREAAFAHLRLFDAAHEVLDGGGGEQGVGGHRRGEGIPLQAKGCQQWIVHQSSSVGGVGSLGK